VTESPTSAPFDGIERRLLRPRATGLFVTWVPEPPAAAGLAVGDTLVSAHEQPLRSVHELRAAFQPIEGESEPVPLGVVDAAGGARTLALPRGPLDLGCVPVEANRPAWDERPDAGGEPDLAFVSARQELWFAARFGETPAGYERLRVEPLPDGAGFRLDHLTRLGGETDGHAWSWRIRVASSHGRDALLSTTRVECEHGTAGQGVTRTEIELDDARVWRGARLHPDGTREVIERPMPVAAALPSYAVPLLAATMPLRAGARRTFPLLMEGDGTVRGRARLEVAGRDACRIDGLERDAWRVVWIHYGRPKGAETFWVTDDRRLVRIDWGEDYAGCWCEESTRERVAEELPDGVEPE